MTGTLPNWLLVVLILAGSLFALKLAYVTGAILALPATGGALYVSTSRRRLAAILEAVPMRPGQILVDLGCGDGRVLRLARRRYGVRAIGYELNPLACLRAHLQCLGLPGIDIRWRNFCEADLSEADVVFCYLFPDVLKLLTPRLQTGLKPGAMVISCNFPLPGHMPKRIIRPESPPGSAPIYIYQF